MASPSTALAATFLVLLLAASADTASAAISCGFVASNIAPCRPYVNNGGRIPPGCCRGISNVNNAARTTADRRAACNCLKSLIGGLTGPAAARAAGLPGSCGVGIPYPISRSVNCNRIG